MLFNSFEFLLFLILVFLIYWGVLKKSLKKQNILILLASYVFYGWWDYRFLSLILLSTVIDYSIALCIEQSAALNKRKALLWLSLVVNLGMLGVFKYYNFFIDNWINAWANFGVMMHKSSLNIVLPVGISFYTFQTLSYTIDVYRGKLKPTKDFVAFAGFVSFFPQLVAGPIERATQLLPQFYKQRSFNTDKAIGGVQLIIWGLFKKVVIADSCAVYVNTIFNNYESLDSFTLALGAIYFAFQIYGDFSGYSDIAIGTARLLGFNLMTNFRTPYFSRDIAEFWRRWHISLSTWFRDYLYIPLGGSKGTMWKQVRNVFIIFIVSGFWHGANWTFIFWGALNAFYFLPLLIFKLNRKNIEDIDTQFGLPSVKTFLKILLTFLLTCFAWIFFRADNLTHATAYICKMFSIENIKLFEYLPIDRYAVEMIPLLIVLTSFEWFSRTKEQPLKGNYSFLKTIVVFALIIIFGVYSNQTDFIYFQF